MKLQNDTIVERNSTDESSDANLHAVLQDEMHDVKGGAATDVSCKTNLNAKALDEAFNNNLHLSLQNDACAERNSLDEISNTSLHTQLHRETHDIEGNTATDLSHESPKLKRKTIDEA